jgi:hypothetical protein
MKNSEIQGITAHEASRLLKDFASAMPSMAQAFKRLEAAIAPTTEALKNHWNICQPFYDLYSTRQDQRRKVKKRFSIVILLLLSMFVHAQDIEYVRSLDSLNNESARAFADQVILDSKTKFEFLRIDETTKNPENFHEVVYIPIDAVDKDRKKSPFVICDECIKVKFYIYYAGENKDLEKKGVRALRFDEVSGRYLDLFPVWKRIFKPAAEVEKTLEDFRSQQLKQKSPNIDYRFYKNSNIENNWYIHNYS